MKKGKEKAYKQIVASCRAAEGRIGANNQEIKRQKIRQFRVTNGRRMMVL
jgi:hypothetical protein